MSFKSKINLRAGRSDSNIVLALDLPPNDPKSLLSHSIQVLEETHPYLCAVKINRHLTLPLGLFGGIQKILDLARDLGLPTIMDCKINDIGNTNRIIADYYYKAGFDAVTANPFVGWNEGLQPVFEIAKQMRRGVILLAYMSHKAAEEGYGQMIRNNNTRELRPQYVVFAEKALLWNADGVVVGATYPNKIKELCKILGDRVPVYSPGVGLQGGDVEAAIKAGARYLIVGRKITLAEDPIESARHLRDAAKACLKRQC